MLRPWLAGPLRRALCRAMSTEQQTVLTLRRSTDDEQDRMAAFVPNKIRNFSIIAHIDHGKSTLADALLLRTGNITVEQRKLRQQQTDTLQVEQERGITVKAQTASMLYKNEFLLNLIDTPGHVDFSYEVTRSLSCCQAALLLVDACQGIQAQTISAYQRAVEAGIKILPVVTKIDLPNAQAEDTMLAMAATFDLDPETVICTSAKLGVGMDAVLDAIVQHVPSPEGALGTVTDAIRPLRGRIIDTWFDSMRGVVCLVQCVEGTLQEEDRITTCHMLASPDTADESFSLREVGLLTPAPLRTRALYPGQVGYVVAGMKHTRQALLGDTIVHAPSRRADNTADLRIPPPLPFFSPSKSLLFASVYPMDGDAFETLLLAVERLALNDASLEIERESSTTLGNGLRIGFLGALHMEVFHQRLMDEFGCQVLLTPPNVPFQFKNTVTGEPYTVVNLADWPKSNADHRCSSKNTVYEPMVEASIITPADCLGNMLGLLKDKRGEEVESRFLDERQVMLVFNIPWQEVVTDFHDKAKNISSGYASFSYKELPPKQADLVMCEMAINNEVVDSLSFVAHRSKVEAQGRQLAVRLKQVIQRQQFEVVIQARLGSKPFARERIPPYRKDVMTTKAGKTVGGGDPSRKRKLLEKQKDGKRKAKTVGKVVLTQEAFWSVLTKK